MTDKLLTAVEVSRRLDCSVRYVMDEIRRKNLRASKLNGWRVSEADLQTYIDAKANVSAVRRSA